MLAALGALLLVLTPPGGGAGQRGVSGAASSLPGPEAAELVRAAHEAFTGSLNLLGVVAAGLFAVLAVATSRITPDA